MKKILAIALSAALIAGVFALAGCGNRSAGDENATTAQSAPVSTDGEEAGDTGNRVVSHTVSLSDNGGEITFSVEVDKDDKLITVTQKSVFRASTQENYEEACSEYTETVNAENAEGYDFRTSAFSCDDANLEAVIIRTWDVAKNTEGKDISNTLKFVKEDGTFDLAGWEAQFDASEENG